MEVRWNKEQDGLIDGFFRRISEDALSGFIPRLNDTGQILRDNRVVRGINHRGQKSSSLRRVKRIRHSSSSGQNFSIFARCSSKSKVRTHSPLRESLLGHRNLGTSPESREPSYGARPMKERLVGTLKGRRAAAGPGFLRCEV